MIWTDGAKYEGNWCFGYPSGKGKFTYPTRQQSDKSTNASSEKSENNEFLTKVYEGNWAHNIMHGFGEVKNPNGSLYRGNWSYGY